MKPSPFDYVRAETLEHACTLLAESGEDGRLLAGGQSLIPMMNLRLARPAVVIDIGRLPLDRIDIAGSTIRIGALTHHRQVLEHAQLRRIAPIFAETARYIAHPTIRNFGTAGGSVGHADPTAEIPTLLVLLDGHVEAASQKGTRQIAAADLFRSAFTTSLAANEIITNLTFQIPKGSHGTCFLELAERDGDYALAAAGAVVERNGDSIVDARIVLTGAESVPVRAPEAEAMLAGKTLTEALAIEAGAAAIGRHQSYADIRASAEYRRHLLSEFTRRALLTAYARAGAPS